MRPRPPITRIALDLDGVIADFSSHACIACGVPPPPRGLVGEHWLYDTIGKPEMWSFCRGRAFWESIPLFPWSHALHDLVADSGIEWIYLTKPSADAESHAGKYAWVQHHFHDAHPHLWLTHGIKAMMARGPGDLLIDDKRANLLSWEDAGGTSFHWREMTSDMDPAYVQERLDCLKHRLNPQYDPLQCELFPTYPAS